MKIIDTQYGIEITKPHNKAMYEHNDKVAEDMKANILNAWKTELAIVKEYHNVNALVEEWDEDLLKEHAPNLVGLQRGVCYSGYGSGYTIDDVNEEFIKELDMMANWQLHQEYGYLVSQDLVSKVKFPMLGHGTEETYHTEESIN